MQQTNKYKLNLVEKSDTFSPDPLNENMQKVESAITAETAAEAAARKSADNALDQRVKVLEGRKLVCGTCTASATAQTTELGFTPALVFVHRGSSDVTAMALEGQSYSRYVSLSIVPGGFSIRTSMDGYYGGYFYLAIL